MNSKHILLVEDHTDSRTALVWLLESHGHQIEAVGNVLTALATLDRRDFEVLLTDILMPSLNGWNLLDKLKVSGQSRPASSL